LQNFNRNFANPVPPPTDRSAAIHSEKALKTGSKRPINRHLFIFAEKARVGYYARQGSCPPISRFFYSVSDGATANSQIPDRIFAVQNLTTIGAGCGNAAPKYQ